MFQYFVEAGTIAVRRVRKEDMRHIAKATGGTMVSCVFSLVISISMPCWFATENF